MADIPISDESFKNLPDLDIRQYDHWRDWTYNLQLGQINLSGIENSSPFGSAAFIIGQGTIAELRENRKKDSQPYIIPVDEKADELVLADASHEERKTAFINSVFKHLRGWVSGETKEEKQYYPTAALTIGSAVLETDPQTIKSLVLQRIENSSLLEIYKNQFKKALAEVEEANVKKIIDYLKFSQTQMTNSETYFIQTGNKEPPSLAGAILTIGNETYKIEGEDIGGIPLTQEDENLLIPLFAANHRSRRDMIEQAKETARQVFNKDPKTIPDPPKWWVEGEDSKGISSKDILVYLPRRDPETQLPHFFEEVGQFARDRNGWFKTEVRKQKNGPSLLVMAARLTS
jgi:hypothetical protein